MGFHSLRLDEWQAFHSSHAAPTFFATPAWSLAVAESNPEYRIYPTAVTLSSGKHVVVPMLRAVGGRLKWRVLVAMPFGAYTAILTEDGELVEQKGVDEVLHVLRQLSDSIEVTLWPLGPQPSRLRDRTKPAETSVIDLSRGGDVALESMEGTSRRMALQATRKGVECSVERGETAIVTYFDILVQAAKKWGLERPTISKELLLSVERHGGDQVEVWLARFEGNAIAGGIVLYGADEAFFWTAGTLPDYGTLRAHNAISMEIIKAAAMRQVRWLNLGASEGLPGVQRFKRNLGAEQISYSTYCWERPIYRLVQAVRSRWSDPHRSETPDKRKHR